MAAWFRAIQVIIAHHLATKGLHEAFTQQIRPVQGLLARLCDQRITPFEAAFMEPFGRRYLSHRSRALVARLSDVDRPCLEPSRTLFQQHSFAERWTSETIGGIFTLSGEALHRL